MGAIKNLFIELQNEYGMNLEFLPKDFDIQKYMQEKANEKIKNDGDS
jgi:hypothetical protein